MSGMDGVSGVSGSSGVSGADGHGSVMQPDGAQGRQTLLG